MFEAKKKSLKSADPKPVLKKGVRKAATTGESPFLTAGLKKARTVHSGGGDMKYTTSGSPFVDQFSSLSIWKKPRPVAEIWASQEKLWNINPLLSVMFILFIRTITRVVTLWDGKRTENPQRGSGLKHEAICRMLWLAINHEDTFWKNVHLFVAVGSWKDIFTMMTMDLVYHDWEGKKLNFAKFADFIQIGLGESNQLDLIKKYLPSIDARSKNNTVEAQAKTAVAKFLASKMGLTYEQYRKLKSTGTAHSWQQTISKKRVSEINFDSIHGRALMLLVKSKFLKNNGLTDLYTKWITSRPTAKFTGFVAELVPLINKGDAASVATANAQFEGLIETAKKGMETETSLIAVVDTSGSMESNAVGLSISSKSVAISMACYFSRLLTGRFSGAWIEFNSSARMMSFSSTTFSKMYTTAMKESCVGSTNFQSVVQLLCSIRKQGVAEKDFPTGILCISDGEFNSGSLNQTNVELCLNALRSAGFSKKYVDNFQIVLWNVPNNFYSRTPGVKFETYGDVRNVFYISGYDASIISFLTTGEYKGAPVVGSAEELFNAAMNQEILNMVEV